MAQCHCFAPLNVLCNNKDHFPIELMLLMGRNTSSIAFPLRHIQHSILVCRTDLLKRVEPIEYIVN